MEIKDYEVVPRLLSDQAACLEISAQESGNASKEVKLHERVHSMCAEESSHLINTLTFEKVQVETEESSLFKITTASQSSRDECCVFIEGRLSHRGGAELNICASGFDIMQIGDSTKLDVENHAVSKQLCDRNEDHQVDSAASWDVHHLAQLNRPMPVISKRGSLNTPRYESLLGKLKHLQDTGAFQTHEKYVQHLEASYLRKGDLDLVVSFQIERAKTLYYQNNLKDSKKELKLVLRKEATLENPGVLRGRALVLLTAVYKREKKYGKAMTCVENARTHLINQDSPDDQAQLHHSYGALITAIPPPKELQAKETSKQEVYKAYDMACNCATDIGFRKYVCVKIAGMLLQSTSKAGRMQQVVGKQELQEAKKHLDFVDYGESGCRRSLGTRITLLNLRSDQLFQEGLFAMARERAVEANELINKHGFKLESGAAKKRLDLMSTVLLTPDTTPDGACEADSDDG